MRVNIIRRISESDPNLLIVYNKKISELTTGADESSDIVYIITKRQTDDSVTLKAHKVQ